MLFFSDFTQELRNFKPISTNKYKMKIEIKLQSIKCLQFTMMLVVSVMKKPDITRISFRKFQALYFDSTIVSMF